MKTTTAKTAAKSRMEMTLKVWLAVYVMLRTVTAHAWLEQPAGRSSAWRLGFPTPKNYNDHELNCGGFDNQHNAEGGRCGLCGDPNSGPRFHEPGPSNLYATGVIVANYTQGQSFAVKIRITASHKGYHEFRLCVNDLRQDGLSPANAAKCISATPTFPLLASPSGQTRFDEQDSAIVLRLPANVTCEACILQWRWRTGNRWGCDADGCGMGHGNQEEFYGCSDVRIVPGSRAGLEDKSKTSTEFLSTRAMAADAISSSTSAPTKLFSTSPASIARSQDSTTTSGGGRRKACVAVSPYKDDVSLWCNINCNRAVAYCPATHCRCS